MNSDPNITNYCNRKSLELSVAFCEIFFFYYSNSDILNPILMHRVQSGNGNEHSEPLFTPVFSCLTKVNTVAYFCFQIRIVDTKIYTSRNSIIMIVMTSENTNTQQKNGLSVLSSTWYFSLMRSFHSLHCNLIHPN